MLCACSRRDRSAVLLFCCEQCGAPGVLKPLAAGCRLLSRLAMYGASDDQVPPTLFWPFNQTAHGVKPWNYQCPQCRHGGALPGSGRSGLSHFDPWCDDVTCGVGPPAPGPPAPPPTPPAPAPTPACPASWRIFNGGIGSSRNLDIAVVAANDWEECCKACIGHSGCTAWTMFTVTGGKCHLHNNQLDQHPGLANRISGLQTKRST